MIFLLAQTMRPISEPLEPLHKAAVDDLYEFVERHFVGHSGNGSRNDFLVELLEEEGAPTRPARQRCAVAR